MARKKYGLVVDGLEEYMAKLEKLGGTQTMKRAVEDALKESKQYINPQITKAMQKSNLPAHGQYSQGETIKTLDKDMAVEWAGNVGAVKIGFDLSKGRGLVSIFLMYGTPRTSPVRGLKAAIYGAKTKKEIKKIQAEAIEKVIQRMMG